MKKLVAILLLMASYVQAMEQQGAINAQTNRQTLVRSALIQAIQPKPAGLTDNAVRDFWKRAQEAEHGFVSLQEQKQQYPEYIQECITIVEHHVGLSIVVKLGLGAEKAQAQKDETQFGPESAAVKKYYELFKQRMDAVEQVTFAQWFNTTAAEGLSVVKQCADVCDTRPSFGGTAIVSKEKARAISDAFEAEITRALDEIMAAK